MNPAKAAWFATVGYRPHAHQRLFHESGARFRIPLCGRRFGKSKMSATDKQPELFKPGNRGWICGPTYDLGEKEFRVFWDDLIIGQELGKHPNVKKAYSVKQGNMYIELPNRARVEVRSSDHPDSLVGEGLDWLIMSEAAKHPEGIWERYLRPALADKRGTADFPTTPEGENWLYRLWQLGQGERNPEYESWNFPSWYNTVVFPGGRDDPEIMAAYNDAVTFGRVEWFDQEYGAVPTSFVGKIFRDFSESTHVLREPYTFNPAWRSYVAFDWGFTNPFAAIWFQVTPGDIVIVWREYYKSGLTLAEHIDVMENMEQPDGYHLDLGFGDAADPEAALYMTQHFIPTLVDTAAKENWREGVDLIASFLAPVETGNVIDEYGTPEMAPRFFIDPSCITFIHEMNNYRQVSAPKTGSDPQDKPKKKSDHGIDAMRYALMHLFKLGASMDVNQLAVANPHLFVAQPGIHLPSPQLVEAVAAPVERGAGSTDALADLGAGGTIFNFGDEEYVF
jgi:hypothetical protein